MFKNIVALLSMLSSTWLHHILLNYLPFTNLEGISGQARKTFFVISPVLTKTYGERTFAHAAPIMWNNLSRLFKIS